MSSDRNYNYENWSRLDMQNYVQTHSSSRGAYAPTRAQSVDAAEKGLAITLSASFLSFLLVSVAFAFGGGLWSGDYWLSLVYIEPLLLTLAVLFGLYIVGTHRENHRRYRDFNRILNKNLQEENHGV